MSEVKHMENNVSNGPISREHSPIAVTMSPVESVPARLTGEPRGIPLPNLQRSEGEVARRFRPDSWFASNGTALSRVLSTHALATSLSQESQPPVRNGAPTNLRECDQTNENGPDRQMGREQSRATTASTVTDIVQEILIGSDDRQRIADTHALPYAWICDLSIIDATGTEWLGTGWLASPRLVITAGHCVYLTNQGGWARSITVTPSRDGADKPYTFHALELHSVDGWVNDAQQGCDYGAIILPAEAQDELGYFGFATLTNEELSGELVNVVGYPADKPEGTLWGSVRTLEATLPDILAYDNDTYGGMSGSPVIQWDGSDYFVLGIHNYGDIRGNRATRITASVFDNIQRWASRASSL